MQTLSALSTTIRTLPWFIFGLLLPLQAMSEPQQTGIVIMHGKGGSPFKHVAELAHALEEKGYLVANLEMPWSGKNAYDVDVRAAEEQLEAALSSLRSAGANKVFVAGHSQGAVFALHFAGMHVVDGIICIAPGGSVESKVFHAKLGDSLARANLLVANGAENEKTTLYDFDGQKGLFPVKTTPAIYLTWFDAEGAMNSQRAAEAANPQIPILWIVPKQEKPAIKRRNIQIFDSLPKNDSTLLFEPNTDQLGAPSASLDEIVRWTSEVFSSER